MPTLSLPQFATHRRALIPIVLAVLLSPLLAAAAPRPPNILLIVGDDMGYADVGFHGCKDVPTPHLDALADDGVRFKIGRAHV